MRPLALAIAALIALPATALAKSGLGLEGSVPVDLAAGEPWYAVVVAIRHDRPAVLPRSADPAVAIAKLGSPERRRFVAHRRRGRTYAARVVFPSPGTWRFRMTGFGALGANQEWEPVKVHRRTLAGDRARSASGRARNVEGVGSGDGFPLGWIAAAAPILIALGLWLERRRRRT